MNEIYIKSTFCRFHITTIECRFIFVSSFKNLRTPFYEGKVWNGKDCMTKLQHFHYILLQWSQLFVKVCIRSWYDVTVNFMVVLTCALCNIIDLPTSLKTQLISLTKRHFVKFSINFHSLFSPCAENFDLHRTACWMIGLWTDLNWIMVNTDFNR